MSASTKLSTSVKALCYLAANHPKPKNSNDISEYLGVNASKLRKLLSMLSKNGIVKSNKGSLGGFLLQKSPNNIHLQEIYCAIEDRKAFHLDVANKEMVKRDSKNFNEFFLNLFAEVQVEIESKMKKISLSHYYIQ